jgi:hypothetical protein
LIETYRRFSGATASIIKAMKEAASTSETSANFYQTAGRNIPDDVIRFRQ